MKTCPKCKAVYRDEEINFCLADGTTLIEKKGKNGTKHSYLNDVVAIIVGAVGLLVLLSLLTSSMDDPSIFGTGNGGAMHNRIGPFGANIAALLLGFFGWMAYLFPFLIALVGWRVFKSETLIPSALRTAGFVLFAISLAGLISLFGGYGAIIGDAVSQGIGHFIGKIGTGVILLAVFASTLIIITDATLAGFLSHFDVAWSNVRIRIDEWREKKRVDNSGQTAAAKKRADKRREIRENGPESIPPTISVGDVEAMAATAVAGRLTTPSFPDEPYESIPTIDADDPYETTKVDEGSLPAIVDVRDETAAAEPGTDPEPVDAEPDENEPVSVISGISAREYKNYKLPTSDMLTPPAARIIQDDAELHAIAKDLEEKTAEFNVGGRVMNISKGPVVTTYEFKPDAGVKYSRVTGLVDDLCLALKAESIRIDRIPGKAYVGIEVPNRKRETIYLREVIESPKFKDSSSLLTLSLGKTIDGVNYVNDLAKMPHLLIAGATGAGKSVGVNTLVMSILYKAKPDEVKFIMVDPKRLELGLYADIPHLSTPIITDPKRAATALRWAVSEMEKRYKDLAGYGVRNIDGYNEKMRQYIADERLDDNGDPHRILPYIVIIIDELADLMMVSGKEVEESITRLAQMARAVGIHLVLATQRPSVDVITGLIKANFPSRISFRVSSKVDSRTIIDGNGAESLLGQGDMLFLPPGNSNVTRVHGAFVNEAEIKKVVDHIKAQGRPEYDTTITRTEEEMDNSGELPGRKDPLFMDALKCIVQAKRGSTSLLQRHLRIGYGRAAAILDAMVREGYIGEMDGSTRARPVLQKAYDDLQDIAEGALGDDSPPF